MLFKSHFSTNEESDLSAGRGLGLDIIKNYVQCLRGEVKILDSNKGLKLEIKFPNDVEDIIQPNGFHLLTNLINESFVSSFKSKQVNVFLHDKSLKEDIILGNKLSIAEIFLFISEYLKKSAFDFERIFIDVFKFEGKRKIDFDNVYRLVIGVQGDAVDFDRRDPYLERAKDLSKKLGGSFIFRGQSLVELNLPSGFKGGGTFNNFSIIAPKKYQKPLSAGIERFFENKTMDWQYHVDWVESFTDSKFSPESRIIFASIEDLNLENTAKIRKSDSVVIMNMEEKDFEKISAMNLSSSQVFFVNISDGEEIISSVISKLLVKRFDKQLSSAVVMEDYKLAS